MINIPGIILNNFTVIVIRKILEYMDNIKLKDSLKDIP